MLATLLAYHGSFEGPFVLDDEATIVENPTIRDLGSWRVLSPAAPLTAAGRPLVNLSLAVNYAAGGTSVRGYHVVNLGIHVAATLVLFALVRRTLWLPSLAHRLGDAGTSIAFATALLWAVHPLQTESVTYVVQRAESLVGLFYLLTLYAFVRGATAVRPLPWLIAAAAACLAGMATKEVMVSAPLVVFLYDIAFVAGGWREAVRRRWPVHAALAATWALLAFLVTATAGRGGTAGAGTGITWWAYALTQCQAVIRYLRLAFWPDPLVFFYGTGVVAGPREVAVEAVVLALLVAGTVAAWRRRPGLGFLGTAFFAVLAPSSSVIPIATQTVAEHRMYLALAAVLAALVVALHSRVGRGLPAVVLVWAAVLSVLTVRRNRVYASEETLWGDTAAKRPEAYAAQVNFGAALFKAGRFSEAIEPYERAMRLRGDDAGLRCNLGLALARAGRLEDGIVQFQAALQLAPHHPDIHYNLGRILAGAGRREEGARHLREALSLQPGHAWAMEELAALGPLSP